jgi:N-acetylneuraminic acid mutarotase
MYAASGRCTSRYSLFGETIPAVDVFDFQTRTWLTSKLPGDLPSPRAGAAVAVLNGKILVMGGESSTQTDAFDTVNSLDPTTRTWSALEPMKHARHGTQAITSGMGIFIAGGSPARGHGVQVCPRK